MTLQQIRYCMEISRCGSISRAAQELCLTQPYLSNILRDLEAELGIEIFIRNRKGVTLTEDGKAFIQYARPMLEQEALIKRLYDRRSEQPPFRFTLSTQRYPFIVKAFYSFIKTVDADRFDIHLRETSMDNVVRDVYEQQSDLGIIFLSTSTEDFLKRYITSRGIEFHEIATLRPRVFFHHKHPMASHESVTIKEMLAYPYASFETTASLSNDFSEEAIILGQVQLKKRFYVTDRATMINTLTHTLAFSIGSGILPKGFAGPELMSRPIRGYDGQIRLGWICPESVPVSDVALQFLEAVEREFAELRQYGL